MARVTTTKSIRPRFSFIGNRFKFIGDVVGELRKVMWPTRQELLRLTIMVLLTCALFATILGLFDWGFNKLVMDVFIGK
ncbi:MAG: preprotein translocase subunit SecE [Chloroflexota bacterium]|nr:preprotein translocase subunit SecE [Chloroflexota bacterium]